MTQEIYIEHLQKLGTLVHVSLGSDFTKSTEALDSLNALLVKEPKLLSFLFNKDNQKVLADLTNSFAGKTPKLTDMPKIFGSLQKLKI